jgi:hypothetical protein
MCLAVASALAFMTAVCAACTATRTPQTASPTTMTPQPSEQRLTVEIENNGPGGIHRPPILVEVVDRSGQLTSARAESHADIVAAGQLPDEFINVRPLDADGKVVDVVWFGTVCDRTATLTVSAGRDHILVAEGPRESCDLTADRRGVVLTFRTPSPAARFSPELRTREPSGS